MKRALALAFTVLVGSLIPGHAFATNNDQDGASPGCDARFERRAAALVDILRNVRYPGMKIIGYILMVLRSFATERSFGQSSGW